MRALSEADGRELVKDYPDTIENGIYIGHLDHKAWGRSSSLKIFFSLASGEKIIASCFQSRGANKIYGPRDDSLDFSEPDTIGKKYELNLVKSKAGFINIKSAHEL